MAPLAAVGADEEPLGPVAAAPGLLAVLPPGVAPVAPVAPGVVTAGAGAAGAGAAGAGAVTEMVAAVVGESKPPASLTSATAITPIESAATTAMAKIGAFQFDELARRVRAAAPQCRHQSCSG